MKTFDTRRCSQEKKPTQVLRDLNQLRQKQLKSLCKF